MEALFIPWVLLVLCVCFVVCLLKKWWKVGIGLCLFLFALNWYWHVFSFGLGSIDNKRGNDCIRVMTWNVCSADTTGTEDLEGLVNVILREEPDVVFITEYSTYYRPQIDSLLRIHYPYKGNIENWASFSELYSKLPIDTCTQMKTENGSGIFRYTVNHSVRPLHFYCVHLQSNNLVNGGSFYPDSIQDKEGVLQYLENYKTAAAIRREQARLIADDMTDAPTIVMGDMNDVAGSPCMKVLEDAGLKDTWWEGGLGYGATIHEPLAYRIDHVLYSGGLRGSRGSRSLKGSESSEGLKGLRLKGIKKVCAKGLSDHDALVADFEIE